MPEHGNTSVGFAADLLLAVATDVEFLRPSPYVDDPIATPFRPDAAGFLTIPDKPGLGIELNREALKRFGG